MKRIFTILLILILHFSMYAQEVSFTREERKLIRKCNTARFSIVHGVRMKEFIRLMNLARKDGILLQKYIRAKYGDEYAEKPVFFKETHLHANNKWEVNRPLLRPSVGLQFGSWLHGKYGGFTGHTGHKFFKQRSLITMNFMAFTPGNTIGENCAYGYNKAIDNFTSLMESIAHRSNILDPSYYRVGVSKSFHPDYKRSCISMFSGKKIRDYILPWAYIE